MERKLWRTGEIVGNLREFYHPVDKPVENRADLLTRAARTGPRDRFASSGVPTHRWLAVVVAFAALAGCERRREGNAASGTAVPAGAIRRVVTTTPSSTEIVSVAGGAGRIVGVDRFSDFPPGVAGLPVVGDFMSPSIEAILQLRPDLVVLDAVQTKTAEALEQGGVRTLVLEMHTVEDVLAGITSVGRALGSDAEAAGARVALERDIEAMRARGVARSRRPRVLLVVDRELGVLRGLVAAGPGSYLDELLAMVGADNVLAGAGTRYSSIAPETVVEARPDIILDAVHTEDPSRAARDWQALARVPAVASGRVHILVDTYYKSPGPRLALALRGLEKLVYPDAP